MKKRLLAIVNPISGVGRQKKIERLLQTNLNQDLYDYEVRYTERIHHGTELARQGADQGFDVITAVGGDGSVNDVIAGMHGSDATLGIIPCGSANGLARCMKIPLTPAFAIRVLNQNNPGLIDTITLNDKYYIASYEDFVGLEHFYMLAELEVVGIDKGTRDGYMFDGDFVNDADVYESVVELGLRCHGGVVAELVAVGEGGEPGFAVYLFAVDDEGVFF